MKQFCPQCEREITEHNRIVTYDWGDGEIVRCYTCASFDDLADVAPTLDTNDILDATERVVTYDWKAPSTRVYLNIGGTPGCITFSMDVLVKASDGNTNPLEWRLEDEFARNVDLSGGGEEIAEAWLTDQEQFDVAGGVREVWD